MVTKFEMPSRFQEGVRFIRCEYIEKAKAKTMILEVIRKWMVVAKARKQWDYFLQE